MPAAAPPEVGRLAVRVVTDPSHHNLGIDPAKRDARLLTHGRCDHFGGMVEFFAAHRQKLKRGLPFYLGSEAFT
ncbi:MAG: hypothetical protein ACKVQU_00770 [Burkholderiales bacterium]